MTERIELAIIATDAASDILDKIGSKFGALGQLGITAIGAVAGAFAGLVSAGAEAQDVQAMFNATLDNSPLAKYKDQLLQLSDAYSKTTRFEDETILSAATVLARYGNLGDKITEMIPLTLDFATLMKEDATSAAQELGKALEDISGGSLGLLARTRLLSKEEREFAESLAKAGKNGEAQSYIIGILEKKTGGMAEKMGQTWKGRMEIFKNTMSNIAEDMGMKLLPALEPVLTKFTELAEKVAPVLVDMFGNYIVPAVRHLTEALLDMQRPLEKMFSGGFGGTISGLGDMLKSVLGNVLEAVKTIDWHQVGKFIADGIKSIDWNKLGGDIRSALETLVQIIYEILSGLIQDVDWKELFGSIALAFGEFTAGLAGYKWDDVADMAAGLVNVFSTTMELVGQVVKTKLNEVRDYIVNFFPNLAAMWVNNWNMLLQILGGIWQLVIETVQSSVDGVITAVVDGLGSVINSALRFAGNFVDVGVSIIRNIIAGVVNEGSELIQAIIDLVSTAVRELMGLSWLFGASPSITIPGTKVKPEADGGDVTMGQTYLVGERGPEMFVPSQNGAIIPNNQMQINYLYGPTSLVISGEGADGLLGLRV